MKEITEGCPRTWKLFVKYIQTVENFPIYECIENCDIMALYGFFVLGFFPKHGIEIERNRGEDSKDQIMYHVVVDGKCQDCSFSHEKAIREASEILENDLKGDKNACS